MPKGKKNKSGGGGLGKEFQAEEVLQAVVLADSFSAVRFRPMSLERPKVLLPLVNVPMLEYTLEFLAAGGVQQIFVVCTAYANIIDDYLSRSQWTRKAPGLTVQIIISEDAFSAGDALRHLDNLNLIQHDFVLISGDVISNIKLDTVVKAHKDRFKKDKRNLMTIVLKRAALNHRTRSLADDSIFAVVPESRQLVLYDNALDGHSVKFPVSLFEEHKGLRLRYDLMDTHIDVCTPEVLSLFTDNFDYQDVRRDFVTGILGSEILGNKIYIHEIHGEYAARITDMKTYDSVSKDIIARWTHPLVPDNNVLGDTSYSYSRGNVYKEKDHASHRDVALARSAELGMNTVLGAGSSIGEHSRIEQSVVGRDCIIGNNVVITNSYVWGTCRIEDGARVDRAVLCDGVVVGAGASIGKGSILSYNVIVGAKAQVPPFSLLTTAAPASSASMGDYSDEDSSGSSGSASSKAAGQEALQQSAVAADVLGVGGVGRIFEENDEEDPEDDEDGPVKRLQRMHANTLAPDDGLRSALWQMQDELDQSDEEDFLEDVGEMDDADAGSADEEFKQTMDDAEIMRQRFFREVGETIVRGHNEKLPVDNIKLEVASLKLSHNATVTDYGRAVGHCLLEIAESEAKPPVTNGLVKMTKGMLAALKAVVKRWGALLSKFGRLAHDQVQLLHGIAAAAAMSDDRFGTVFVHFLRQLYTSDVLGEEAVLQWAQASGDKGAPTGDDSSSGDAASVHARMVKKAEPFLTWLQEAESDSDSDE